MLLETLCTDFQKVLSANSTDTSFASKIPTNTEPTGTGVITLNPQGAGGLVQNGMVLVPFGAGSDNDTFSIRVIGWRCFGRSNLRTVIWIPVVLCELSCTLSAVTGVAGLGVVNTDRFADTLTIVTGNSGVSIDVVSPAGDVVAHASVSFKGFQKIEFSFDMTGATSGNALIAVL